MKDCAKNGASKITGREWEERTETLADKSLDFENRSLHAPTFDAVINSVCFSSNKSVISLFFLSSLVV